MSHSPADIVRQLLFDNGLGSAASAWPIFVGFFPEKPNSAMCIYDTAGLPDGRMMRTGEKIEHPAIMVEVRSVSYKEGWRKAKAIADCFDSQERTAVSVESGDSYLIANISRPGTILHLGVDPADKERRHSFTVNVLLTFHGIEWTVEDLFRLQFNTSEGWITLGVDQTQFVLTGTGHRVKPGVGPQLQDVGTSLWHTYILEDGQLKVNPVGEL